MLCTTSTVQDYVVHHCPALCTMVHKRDLCLWELGVASRHFSFFDNEHANQGSQCSYVRTYTLVVHNAALYWLSRSQDDFAWWCTIQRCQSSWYVQYQWDMFLKAFSSFRDDITSSQCFFHPMFLENGEGVYSGAVMVTFFPTQVPISLLPVGTQVPAYWMGHV